MPAPLEGIRILDFSQVVAGPVATMLLAEQGAEVIKIEALEGDILRRGQSFVKNGMNSLTMNCNRGKKSIAIDLRQPEGLAIVMELALTADVVIQNFRAGAIERLGIDADELRAANDRLITVWMSGYGPTGPLAEKPVFDPVIQAVTGHIAVQENPQIPLPDVHRTIIMDKSTALTAAQAITVALFVRERTGQGQHIELAMIDSALYFFWPDGAMRHALLDDDVSAGVTLYESMSVAQCADGHLVYFLVDDANWQGMFRAIEHPEWGEDPRFSTSLARMENLPAAGDLISAALLDFTRDDLLARLDAEDVPAAPMLAVDEVPSYPQVVHNESLVEWDHPQAGRVRSPKAAAKFSATPNEERWWVPTLGEQTDEILSMVGRDDDAIAALRADGIVA